MWCANLPRNRGSLSQVTSPYKLRLNEIRYCSIVAKSSIEILAFLKIEREKYKSLQTKNVTTSPGLPYYVYNSLKTSSFFAIASVCCLIDEERSSKIVDNISKINVVL